MAGIDVCCARWKLAIELDILLVYLFAVALREASLIKTPNNKAVIAGQRMEMECRTDSESLFRRWFFLPAASNSLQTIVTNNSYPELVSNISGFGVHVDQNGSVVLYSNSTVMKNAGVYICQGDTGSTEFKFSAQLVVFESEPKCETNFTANTVLSDGDYIWMQCKVNFRGNWAPTMEWKQHRTNGDEKEGRPVMDGTDTVVIQNSSITSTLIVVIDSTNKESFYSCRTYFTWHNGTLRTDATNVPDFSHTWTSNSTKNFIAGLTTSADTDSKGSTASGIVSSGFFLLLFGVLSISLFLMMMAIVAVCCVIIRKKTAEWMAKVVSTYENHDRPRSLRYSRRLSTESLRMQTKAISLNEEVTIEQEPSEGYTSVDDLIEECNQAIDSRPAKSEMPKYTAVCKKNKVGDAAAHAHYSLAKDDPLLYATLRKDIEPPKWSNMQDDTDSDSENVDLK